MLELHRVRSSFILGLTARILALPWGARVRANKNTCSRQTNAYVSSNSCLRIRRNLDRYLEAATRPIFGSFGEDLSEIYSSPEMSAA